MKGILPRVVIGGTPPISYPVASFTRAPDAKLSFLNPVMPSTFRVSTLLSVTRTYRQLGDGEAAQGSLSRALSSATEWVAEEPGSASAAYWLGRTYDLMGDYPSARVHLEKAAEMQPTSSKYRKAFHRVRRLAGGAPPRDYREGRGAG